MRLRGLVCPVKDEGGFGQPVLVLEIEDGSTVEVGVPFETALEIVALGAQISASKGQAPETSLRLPVEPSFAREVERISSPEKVQGFGDDGDGFVPYKG